MKCEPPKETLHELNPWNGWVERTSNDGLTLQRWGFSDYNAMGLGRTGRGQAPRLGLSAYQEHARASKRQSLQLQRKWSVRQLQENALRAPEVPVPDDVLIEALERYTRSYQPTIDPNAHLQAHYQHEHFQKLIRATVDDEADHQTG